MTFDEYNTDENYDNDKSSLEELVKIGKSEGKSKDEIRKALSPKWQKSSKLNKFDEYYGEDLPKKKEPSADDAVGLKALGAINGGVAAPVSNPPEKKAEDKPAETPKEVTNEEVAEIIGEQTAPDLENEDTGIKQSDKKYMNEVNAILNEEQKKELQKLVKTSADDYKRTMENIERSGDAFKKIDDKLIEQLPTFMFKRYQNGEFGKAGSTDAKLRLAHFLINGVGTALQNASAAIKGGPTKESDIQKYNRTNLEQGLENRWNKYKAETDSAIEMVKSRNMSEEDARNIINKISMNNRLQNAFNMADANKKAYMIEVLSKVGDKVSNWNDQKFINALIGAEMTGEDVGNAAALIGARAGEKILDNFNLFDENGNLDLSALKTAMNIPGFTDKFKTQFGFDPENLLNGGGNSNGGESPTGTTLEDGTNVDPGKYMNSKEYKELVAAGDKLSKQYYNGEIDEEKFRSEYAKLEKIMSEHGWFSFFRNKGIKSADDLIRINNNENLNKLDKELETLNNQANNGNIKPSDYKEKFNSIVERASKWGATEKYLKAINKGRVKDEAIIKASEKNAKKAKKKK